jgi:cellulose biosynthesis protein BcsQ
MSKIRLIIADQDKEYLEYFTKFVRNSDYAEKFVIKSSSSKESTARYIATEAHIDILLTSVDLLPQDLSNQSISCIVLFNDVGKSLNQSYTSIEKYQPLPTILTQLLTIFQEKNDFVSARVTGNRKTKIVSVFSANGGSGKTTVATNLAIHLAARDQKVFYLNLETIQSTGLFFPEDGQDQFSKILYYLQANSRQLGTKFQDTKSVDLHSKVEYFGPLQNCKEMDEVTEEHVQKLLEELCHLGIYDTIIVDLDSSLHVRTLSALKQSDSIFWLFVDDMHSLHKTHQYLRLFGQNAELKALTSRIKFIANKYVGRFTNDFQSIGVTGSLQLPYIPQWKTVSSGNQSVTQTVFYEEVLKIYYSIFR